MVDRHTRARARYACCPPPPSCPPKKGWAVVGPPRSSRASNMSWWWRRRSMQGEGRRRERGWRARHAPMPPPPWAGTHSHPLAPLCGRGLSCISLCARGTCRAARAAGAFWVCGDGSSQWRVGSCQCVVLTRLGAYPAYLRAILGRLSAIVGRLAAILRRLGRILASKNPLKIAPRGLQDASQNEVQHRPQLGDPRRPNNQEKPMEKRIFL